MTVGGNIGVSAVFTLYDTQGNYLTEAGVGSSTPATEFILPVDTTAPFNTGLALQDIGNGNAAITAILYDTGGREAARTSRTLTGRNAHAAEFVAGQNQLFPSIASFRGTLVISSSVPVAALALRQYQTPGKLSYTSLPVVPRTANRLALNLAQVANGAYGQISYQTSFLIFNISSSPAAVVLVTHSRQRPAILSDVSPQPATATASTSIWPPGVRCSSRPMGSGRESPARQR